MGLLTLVYQIIRSSILLHLDFLSLISATATLATSAAAPPPSPHGGEPAQERFGGGGGLRPPPSKLERLVVVE